MNESRQARRSKWRPATQGAVAFAFLVFSSSRLLGQGMHAGFALGAAVPTDDYRETRGTGPLAQVFVVFGGADRRLRLRVEAEGLWLPGRTPATSSTSTGDIYILSGFANLIMGPRSSGIRPYFLLGAGRQLVIVSKVADPYAVSLITSPLGPAIGIRAGFGVEGRLRGSTVRAEIAGNAVFSSFGTGEEYGLGGYFPLTLALQF